MNNEEILKELFEYVKNTEAFVKEQAPLVVQEMIRYGWIDSLCGLGLSILFITAISLALYFYPFPEDAFYKIPAQIVGGYLIFVCVMMGMNMSANLIKITVAPRLYIIDQIKK